MNAYKTYFDRQTISPAAHNRLMALGDNIKEDSRDGSCCRHDRRTVPLSSGRWIALAACAALILGVASFALQNRPVPKPPVVAQTTPSPTGTPAPTFAPDVSDPDPVEPPEDDGFLIHSPATEERLNFYGMPALDRKSVV